ncbi:MAG TPA: hypothetical protein VE152_08415, partial [Acidimicrobiales bacterium]|nr:hypothetical protein [Acidimicrobiales bacterium]
MVAWEGAEFDDDDEGGDETHRPVPDPQDRLWRHPSELARQAPSTGPGGPGGHRAWRHRRPHAPPRSRFLGIALATGAVGALAAALLVYAAARPQLGTTSVVSTTGSGLQGAGEGSSAEAVAAGTTQTSAAVRVGPGVWAMVQRLLPAVVAVDAATSHG